MRGEVWRRSRYLVAHVLGEVWEEPVPLPELVESASVLLDEKGRPKWSAKTVENTVRDLAAFGAVEKSRRGRDVMVVATVLGKAWVAGVVLPGIRGKGVDGRELAEAVAELVDGD